MTKTYYNKLRMDKKKPSQRRCYECKELGHYIADCPKLKNKSNEEKKYKEKSKEFKKKYQGRAHIGEEWDSDDENSKQKGTTTVAMPKSSRKLFNNLSDDKDDIFASWQKG